MREEQEWMVQGVVQLGCISAEVLVLSVYELVMGFFHAQQVALQEVW